LIAKDKIEKELVSNFEIEFRRSTSTSLSKSSRKRQNGTLYFNSHQLIENFSSNLEPFALVALEQRMNLIKDWLEQESWTHFYGNFYLIEKSLEFHNLPELQNRLQWTIADLYTGRILMLTGDNLTSSEGSCFFERLHGLVSVDCKLIDRRDKQFFKLAIINLCNVVDCLHYYVKMPNSDEDNKKLAIDYLKYSLASLTQVLFNNDIPIEDINLLFFVYLSITRCKESLGRSSEDKEQEVYQSIVKKFEEELDRLKTYNKILALCDLYYLDNAKFMVLFERCYNKLIIDWVNRPFYIRILMFYLKNLQIGDDIIKLKISPNFNPLKTDDIIVNLFPEYFENTNEVIIESRDKEKLMSFKDVDIRGRLANIFQRSKFLTEEEKERLVGEAKKPHATSEISDFEVRLGDYPDIIHACMPIKSAREIRDDSVSEKYAYQLLKPFIHLFDRCVVVFITAKPCSLALDAYIKKLISFYNFPIAVIQEDYLCKILKFYNQI